MRIKGTENCALIAGLGSSLAALTSIAEDAMALRRDVYSSVIIEV